MLSEKRYSDLDAIARAGIKRVDPRDMILSRCSFQEDIFSVPGSGGRKISYDLSRYEKVIILGAGKATSKMAAGIETLLGSRITGGTIAVKPGHIEKLKYISQIEASHPVPDDKSEEAARTLLRLAGEGNEKTLFINLISGGGSALLAAPRDGITLKDKQVVTKALLECGAAIQEINCIRKHLSDIKGGLLAQAMSPAHSVNIILSDVVGDPLDTIASGPTVPDETTFQQALGIINKYNIAPRLPDSVVSLIRSGAGGDLQETPKPGDGCFECTEHILLGTNREAVKSALKKAGELGYTTFSLGSFITGEASEAARFLFSLARGIKENQIPIATPACVIGGGETTVTIKGNGKGGRNQECALAFSLECGELPRESGGIFFLSAATDGNDGPTDAAGGYGSLEIRDAGEKAGLDAGRFLADNDAYNYLEKSGALYKTGPTNTNVCDLYILIVE